MTQVNIERAGSRRILSCVGHATGSPAVCAAVSVLVMSLAGWLHSADGVEIFAEKLDDGDVRLEYIASDDTESAFELIIVGFMQLAASYGRYISVTVTDDFEEN